MRPARKPQSHGFTTQTISLFQHAHAANELSARRLVSSHINDNPITQTAASTTACILSPAPTPTAPTTTTYLTTNDHISYVPPLSIPAKTKATATTTSPTPATGENTRQPLPSPPPMM
ncbi:hypothetical protein SprV_0702265400 [Sparganum proliferum]